MPDGQTDRYRRYRRYFINVGTVYKKKQTRVYTGIVLSIFTVAFFGFFAIRPTLTTIGGLLKEIKDKEELVKQMDQKIADLSQAQTNYNQIKKQLYLVDESLPLDPDMPILVKQLEALARLNSVFFETVYYNGVNLQGEPEKEEAQEVDFTITLYGDYKSLKSFLNSLDFLRRVISVDGFSFSSKKIDETQVLVLSITAKAHYLTRNK